MSKGSKSSNGSQTPKPVDFSSIAENHWTAERIAKITAGRKYEILPPGDAPFLRAIGLLASDASMPADAVRKYVQINHMLGLLKAPLMDLRQRHANLAILDAGCGSSFLTLLLAWYLKHKVEGEFLCVGIDTNKALIEKSRALADKLGLQKHMHFEVASTRDFTWENLLERRPALAPFKRPHMVVALHACDTATDEALGLGIKSGADVLAASPCCQAELAAHWRQLAQDPAAREHPMAPAFQAPELRRTIAAEMTDMMRVLLLRAAGYETTATEFVESRHSPKNRLILGLRRGRYSRDAAVAYQKMKAHLGGCAISLESFVDGQEAL
jgi:SAM-dependent methyltransferase